MLSRVCNNSVVYISGQWDYYLCFVLFWRLAPRSVLHGVSLVMTALYKRVVRLDLKTSTKGLRMFPIKHLLLIKSFRFVGHIRSMKKH